MICSKCCTSATESLKCLTWVPTNVDQLSDLDVCNNRILKVLCFSFVLIDSALDAATDHCEFHDEAAPDHVVHSPFPFGLILLGFPFVFRAVTQTFQTLSSRFFYIPLPCQLTLYMSGKLKLSLCIGKHVDAKPHDFTNDPQMLWSVGCLTTVSLCWGPWTCWGTLAGDDTVLIPTYQHLQRSTLPKSWCVWVTMHEPELAVCMILLTMMLGSHHVKWSNAYHKKPFDERVLSMTTLLVMASLWPMPE